MTTGPSTFEWTAIPTIEAAAGGDDSPKDRRFSIVAYDGGPLRIKGWKFPVVIDLEGFRVDNGPHPILLDHKQDIDFVMGQTDSVKRSGNTIVANGPIYTADPSVPVRRAIQLNDSGFAWQASVGATVKPGKIEFIRPGQSVMVNNKRVDGPQIVARSALLRHISFVSQGGADETSAQIAATAAGGNDMEFKQWLTDRDFTLEDLTEKQEKSLQAAFDAEQQTGVPGADDGAGAGDDPPPAETIPGAAGDGEPIEAGLKLDTTGAIAEIRAEASRVRKIDALGKEDHHSEIVAKAIDDGTSFEHTELLIAQADLSHLRESRPKAPAGHIHDNNINPDAIEASLCLQAGLTEKQTGAHYDDTVMEAALSRNYRRVSVGSLITEMARAGGESIGLGGMDDTTIRAALRYNQANMGIEAAAGFSTISLSGILGNVANKSMLEAYNGIESAARRIASATDVSDFKTHTRYRMTAAGIFEEVGPTGELTHAELTEESYTAKAVTYGRMFALTRTMMINDDLGAFLQIPRAIGRMSALKLEEVAFVLLLSNPSTFFGSGNSNVLTTALSIAALTEAEQLFLDQQDSDGRPIMILPRLILVPSGLKVTAEKLFIPNQVNETTSANAPQPNINPHQGKFDVVWSPYLNNSALTGYSTTAWYLFADPNDVPAMEIAYLRGQRTPTIESGDTDFNTLGVQWRGYFDFGAAMQDVRAATKSTGVGT